jgi:hypothetical protein
MPYLLRAIVWLAGVREPLAGVFRVRLLLLSWHRHPWYLLSVCRPVPALPCHPKELTSRSLILWCIISFMSCGGNRACTGKACSTPAHQGDASVPTQLSTTPLTPTYSFRKPARIGQNATARESTCLSCHPSLTLRMTRESRCVSPHLIS